MKHAIIAIEDRRFYTNEGVDLRGIGRAFYQDVRPTARRPGRLDDHPAVRQERARRPGRPHRSSRSCARPRWPTTSRASGPRRRSSRNYLNTIYFGNGAYGIESAARTYFGTAPPGLRDAATALRARAAASRRGGAARRHGRLARPATTRSSIPAASTARRDLVLQRMFDQRFMTPRAVRGRARRSPIPDARDLQPPQEDTKYPYFTSWIKQQVVDQLGGGQRARGARSRPACACTTTIDSRAPGRGRSRDPPVAPVPGRPARGAGGDREQHRQGAGDGRRRRRHYNDSPFNLATQGQRQPGSAFKPFVLAEALKQGISPNSVWASHKLEIKVPHSTGEASRSTTTRAPTRAWRRSPTRIDVLRQLGLRAGRHQGRHAKVARLAERMGIRTPVSHNYAITLGGLKQGVTPARHGARVRDLRGQGGKLIYGTLSPGADNRATTPPPARSGSSRSAARKGDNGEPVKLGRRRGASTTRSSATCSSTRSPTEVGRCCRRSCSRHRHARAGPRAS